MKPYLLLLLAPLLSAAAADMIVRDATGRIRSSVSGLPGASSYTVRDASGRVVRSVQRSPDGTLTVRDATGRIVAVLKPAKP